MKTFLTSPGSPARKFVTGRMPAKRFALVIDKGIANHLAKPKMSHRKFADWLIDGLNKTFQDCFMLGDAGIGRFCALMMELNPSGEFSPKLRAEFRKIERRTLAARVPRGPYRDLTYREAIRRRLARGTMPEAFRQDAERMLAF